MPIHGDDVAFHVHHHTIFAQHHAIVCQLLALRSVIPTATQDGANAGDELAGEVRLGHVIIRAEL